MTRKRISKSHNRSFLTPLIFLLATFVLLQVFFANSLSAQGKEIARLERLEKDLEKEIESLQQKAASLSSLENIRLQAFQRLKMIDGLDSFDYFDALVALR